MSLESQRDCGGAFDQTIAGAISRELHKTAQPLTNLQGLIEIMVARVSGEECRKFLGTASEDTLAGCEECRSFLKRAGEELPRLVDCFNDIRKLAGLQRPPRDITKFMLSALVTDVLETLQNDLDIGGISVIHADPNANGNDALVSASHGRVFSAVHLVLMALADCLDAGDQIKIAIETEGANAIIRLRPTKRTQSGTPAERECWLSTLASQVEFARLMFTSVGGDLHLNQAPDIIVMSLPAAAPLQMATHDGEGKATHV